MKLYQGFLAFSIALLSVVPLNAQNDANGMLRLVYGKMQKAKDYSVQAHIKVDMPFIRMVPVNVKLYFKQKNKFKVESKSIALVPRQGFDQAAKMLSDTNSYTAIVQGEEKIGTIRTKIINVIPLSDTSDMILGKFWIDPQQSVIMKSQLTTRSSGTILTEYSYGSEVAYGLPDKMTFVVDVKKFRPPKGVVAEPDKSNTAKNEKESKKGTIYMVLSHYQVNKGVPDSIFKN